MSTAQNLTTKWTSTDPKAGIDLGAVYTISTTTNPETPGPPFALGERVQGNNGSMWMFVQATTTVTSGNVIAIDANFKAKNHSDVFAASLRYATGVAQFGGATILASGTQGVAGVNDYFWACLDAKAGLLINCITSAAVGTQLYLASTPVGSVIATATGAGPMLGLFANTAFTASGSCTVTDFICIGALRASTSA